MQDVTTTATTIQAAAKNQIYIQGLFKILSDSARRDHEKDYNIALWFIEFRKIEPDYVERSTQIILAGTNYFKKINKSTTGGYEDRADAHLRILSLLPKKKAKKMAEKIWLSTEWNLIRSKLIAVADDADLREVLKHLHVSIKTATGPAGLAFLSAANVNSCLSAAGVKITKKTSQTSVRAQDAKGFGVLKEQTRAIIIDGGCEFLLEKFDEVAIRLLELESEAEDYKKRQATNTNSSEAV